MGVVGTRSQLASCDFSRTQSPSQVFADVESLRENIAEALDQVARRQPVPPIGELIRKLKN